MAIHITSSNYLGQPESVSGLDRATRSISPTSASTPIIWLLVLLVVMRHLGARVVVIALDVERLIFRTAIKDGLVASKIFSDGVKRCQHFLAQVLPLMVLGYRDLFNMAAQTTIVNAVRTSRQLTPGLQRLVQNPKDRPLSQTYNFFSTIKLPVPTIRPSYSMTMR